MNGRLRRLRCTTRHVRCFPPRYFTSRSLPLPSDPPTSAQRPSGGAAALRMDCVSDDESVVRVGVGPRPQHAACSVCKYTSEGCVRLDDARELDKYIREDHGCSCSGSAQNHILISSSETADAVRTPDSVMIPEIRSGGCESLACF